MVSKFFDAFIQGLSGSGLYAEPKGVSPADYGNIAFDSRSDADKLRGDWQKIGGDFRVAIEKTEQSARQ